MNYQLKLEEILKENKDKTPTLLLHSCCAPCSSYVLEYLTNFFQITILFYNPNISSEKEYLKRLNELKRLVKEMPHSNKIEIVEGRYDNKEFLEISKGLEDLKEGGERCFKCYRLRQEEAAKYAKENNFDYFTTTLSISPHKNAEKLNEIGKELSEIYQVSYLYADFKKKGGYQRSIELSKKYDLYRQDFCGCIYSKRDRELEKKEKEKN
ncbi:MAG: epoxyqueuosine reductase QueH [Bacilli bacterium]|nr:epoxyqueuosine reductase QueH [Bacilli bacterium]